MNGLSTPRRFDRMRLSPIADGLAVAVAVSLPWSTSATSILAAVWLIVLLPTLDLAVVRREVATPAGGLPVALVALGMLGMLWAEVTLVERLRGLESFLKLLMIPLLLVQFRRSDRGMRVFAGYLASCSALLVSSAIIARWPELNFLAVHDYGVLVKSAATQSGEFVTCGFVLLFLAVSMLRAKRRTAALWSLILAAGFFADIFYIATGRTALVVIPVLLILLGYRKFGWKGTAGLLVGGALICAAAWMSSPNLQSRTIAVLDELHSYREANEQNSSGERLEFWKKSLGFVRQAPIIGHGTGSIPELFRRSVIGQTGASGSATVNPHNQTFAVAIQLGLVGMAALWAMWIAHLLLFRGDGLAQWIGLVIVVQNIVGSVFNSHLFDFVQGWVYVFGVGVAGGMVYRNRANAPARPEIPGGVPAQAQ